jgi:Bacterial PH domain
MAEIVEHVGPDGEVSRLPAGEKVLWTGAPDQRALARYFLRERWCLAFVAFSFSLGAAVPRLIGVATLSTIMAIVAIVSIRLMAWQIAKSSKYVITDKRVYFNIGIVMRADANIPYSSLDGVDLRRRSDGSADLMLKLTGEQEIPWLLLFPHMTWHGGPRGRPTFRSLRAPQAAADAVVSALRAYPQPAAADTTGATATTVPSGARPSIAAVTPSPA